MATDTLQLLRNSLNLTNMTPNSSPVKSSGLCDGSSFAPGLHFPSEFLDTPQLPIPNSLMTLANIVPSSQGQLTAAFLPDGTMTLLQPVINQPNTTASSNGVFPPLSSIFPVAMQKQSTLDDTSLYTQNLDRKSPPYTNIVSKYTPADCKDKSANSGSKIRQVSDKLLTSTVLQLPPLTLRSAAAADGNISEQMRPRPSELVIGEHNLSFWLLVEK